MDSKSVLAVFGCTLARSIFIHRVLVPTGAFLLKCSRSLAGLAFVCKITPRYLKEFTKSSRVFLLVSWSYWPNLPAFRIFITLVFLLMTSKPLFTQNSSRVKIAYCSFDRSLCPRAKSSAKKPTEASVFLKKESESAMKTVKGNGANLSDWGTPKILGKLPVRYWSIRIKTILLATHWYFTLRKWVILPRVCSLSKSIRLLTQSNAFLKSTKQI